MFFRPLNVSVCQIQNIYNQLAYANFKNLSNIIFFMPYISGFPREIVRHGVPLFLHYLECSWLQITKEPRKYLSIKT